MSHASLKCTIITAPFCSNLPESHVDLILQPGWREAGLASFLLPRSCAQAVSCMSGIAFDCIQVAIPFAEEADGFLQKAVAGSLTK